jgi:hypothetical protein
MRIVRGVILGAAVLSLAACSADRGTRAVEGAGIGGALGAVGTAVVGGPVLAGAAIGAAAGAITGAATTKKQINLGN